MSRQLLLFALSGLAVATADPATSQPKDPPGYWQFVEAVLVEYPEEKLNKYYPTVFAWEGSKLTVVAKALSGIDPRVVITEEHQVWTWTPPPQILVPGEKLAMKLELKLERPVFDKKARLYLGGTVFAGFSPAKPKDSAIYHVNHQTVTAKGERGWLWPGENGATFEPGTFTKESTVVVPARVNPLVGKEHPDQISFRVGGGANGRQFNTRYEYKWVGGEPPADRGGPAGGKAKDPGPGAGGKAKDPGPGAGAGKWDYRVVNLPIDQALGDRLEERLSELGNDGWELAGVIVSPAAAPQATVRLILKRPRR